MKHITLSNGTITIVDDEDYDWLSSFRWYYSGRYPSTSWKFTYKNGLDYRRVVTMHCLLTNFVTIDQGEKIKLHVDHINGNPLDNRKSNLRVVSVGTNIRNSNTRHILPENTYGKPTIFKQGNYFRLRARKNGKFESLGSYVTEELALEYYNTLIHI